MIDWTLLHRVYISFSDEEDTSTADPTSRKWLLNLASGAVSGPVSRTITAPLERFRLLIQIAPTKLTFFQAVHKSIADSGIRGLWRGNLINVLKVGPEISFRFGAYEKMKDLISDENGELSFKAMMLAGASAGVMSHLMVYPMDSLKTKMTIRMTGEYNSAYDAIRKIYKADGLFGFYRGYRAAILGVIPYGAIELVTFEKLKYIYEDSTNRGGIYMAQVAFCALVSTTLAQLFSYPFFLIKSRQQAGGDISHIKELKWATFKAIRIIVNTEGPLGLFRGLLPTLAKSAPSSAINYIVYEMAQDYFKQFF